MNACSPEQAGITTVHVYVPVLGSVDSIEMNGPTPWNDGFQCQGLQRYSTTELGSGRLAIKIVGRQAPQNSSDLLKGSGLGGEAKPRNSGECRKSRAL